MLPSRSIRARRSTLTSKATQAIPSTAPAASAPVKSTTTTVAVALPSVVPAKATTVLPPVASIHIARRKPFAPPPLPSMPPSNRSKSPPKNVRQADSSPKRAPINDTINTERLKLARDEAERAMKVSSIPLIRHDDFRINLGT